MNKYERDQMEKYNGWHNYATWRINLEVFDGLTLRDIDTVETNPHEVSKILKDYVKMGIGDECKYGSLSYGYAMAFVSEVNFYEIAQHLLEQTEEV